MTRINREHMQKRILQHYINITNKQNQITVKHFLQEKAPRQTIYSIINKYEDSGYVGDKPRSAGISLRRLAPQFKVSYQTISNHLKPMGTHYYKKQRAPKYTDQQLQEIPTHARRLYRILSNNDFELLMHDKKYFLLRDQFVPTNRGLCTSDKRTTPPQIKF
ncbi:unnamed protein product [Rotaria socialis]|uniref:Uncharacterized protein n=1 Tax=Rotaria socialis TaxID=392032 RepID=A0A818G430_9BILA|nr:unnamed protein product [Rotaria socialis]CAF3420495.1 unnamed protein product [Rotaria socialis]CAF3485514.1 unnamed protein product [Rotaria socialis]CAF3584547.1 unnamed protein product [Rotaria socialis]CAF4253675.1 unnamed protein product [Rotaria socialis]